MQKICDLTQTRRQTPPSKLEWLCRLMRRLFLCWHELSGCIGHCPDLRMHVFAMLRGLSSLSCMEVETACMLQGCYALTVFVYLLVTGAR